MGFLNRSGFLSSIADVWQTVATSSNLTLTGVGHWRVFVDTTSAPVTITLPTGAKGQSIEIIDAGDNAGTNIITISATIDGVANTTIEADGGSRTFTFNSAWESSGGIDKMFQRVASTGLVKTREPDRLASDRLLGGDPGTSYTGLPATFSNAEANVSQNSGWWGNSYIPDSNPINNGNYNTNATTPYAVSASSDYGGGYEPWRAMDNTSAYWASSISAVNPTWTVDFGSQKTISAFEKSGGASSTIESYILQGSNDNFATTPVDLLDVTNDTSGGSKRTLTTVGSFRYYRVYVRSYTGFTAQINEAKFYEGTIATTTNTFQYRPLSGGSSTSFDPSTFTPKDDTASNLVDGDILIEYSTDGSTWSTQEGLNAFKARSVITSTTFWFRFEMVGAKRLGSATITTASTYTEMNSSGQNIVIDGSSVSTIGAKGMAPISLTTAERDALTGVSAGAIIFNETTSKLNFYTGSGWEAVTSA